MTGLQAVLVPALALAIAIPLAAAYEHRARRRWEAEQRRLAFRQTLAGLARLANQLTLTYTSIGRAAIIAAANMEAQQARLAAAANTSRPGIERFGVELRKMTTWDGP